MHYKFTAPAIYTDDHRGKCPHCGLVIFHVRESECSSPPWTTADQAIRRACKPGHIPNSTTELCERWSWSLRQV